MKRSALALAGLFSLPLGLGAWLSYRGLKRYDPEVWQENRDLTWRVNRWDVLSSRSCVVTAQRPA